LGLGFAQKYESIVFGFDEVCFAKCFNHPLEFKMIPFNCTAIPFNKFPLPDNHSFS